MARFPLQLWLVAAAAAAALVCVLPSCLATVYTVGGPAGWTTPSRAKVNYTDWAAKTPFTVGDSLEFNYVYKAHTVLSVTRTDFRFCNKSSPIESYSAENGKTVVELSKPGNYYFIDGVDDHCEEGQKFQARVSGVVAEATAPTGSERAPSASPAIPPAAGRAAGLATAPLLYVSAAIAAAILSLQLI